jgi:hypothetical protein
LQLDAAGRERTLGMIAARAARRDGGRTGGQERREPQGAAHLGAVRGHAMRHAGERLRAATDAQRRAAVAAQTGDPPPSLAAVQRGAPSAGA